MRKFRFAAAASLTLVAIAVSPGLASKPSTPLAAASTTSLIDKALAGSHRSAANRARDAFRHPRETLRFFGLKPEMTVVEISPAGGWYSEILAPVLRGRGVYYAAHIDPAASAQAEQAVLRFRAKLAEHPNLYDRVRVTSFGKNHYGNLAPPESADMVLTFRNVHNWHMAGFGKEAFAAFYKALKPGGILGVVEHRLPEDRPDAMQSSSGYMKTSQVVRLARAAGFRLAASSEINANPKDTADHPAGVWTLPPALRLGDKDAAKYRAIGESDRMTLKFAKPL